MTQAPSPEPENRVALSAEVEVFVREQLGRCSLRHLSSSAVQASLSARIAKGTPLQDAVLSELHAVLAQDHGVANEFLAFFFYELHRLGKFSMSSSSRLRRFLDTGDLVHSVIGDLWPEVPALEFESRNQFLNLFAKRMGWKAADNARRLSAKSRREDRRIDAQPEDIDLGVAHDDGSDALIREEERERLALVIMRLRSRDRDLIMRRLKGQSIQEIADALDVQYDTARKAVSRALTQARKLGAASERRRPLGR